MVDEDLGQATIVYEDPDDGTVEKTVENEHLAYFQDHWIVKTDEDSAGDDRVRRIPHHRVFYVERSVEEFEEEVTTLRRQVQSFADDLRTRLMGGSDRGEESEPRHIEIGDGDPEDSGNLNQ